MRLKETSESREQVAEELTRDQKDRSKKKETNEYTCRLVTGLTERPHASAAKHEDRGQQRECGRYNCNLAIVHGFLSNRWS